MVPRELRRTRLVIILCIVLVAVAMLGVSGLMPETGDAQEKKRPFVVADGGDVIEATEAGGAVTFRFYFEDDASYDRVRTEGNSLIVRPINATEPIWSVEARSRSSAAREITYGTIPRGFVQRVPTDGVIPPKLEAGVTYVVTGRARQSAAGIFTYRGL